MSALPYREEGLIDEPHWHGGERDRLYLLMRSLTTLSVKEFDEYLREHRIAEMCHIANLIPIEAARGRVYSNFCVYLRCMIEVLMETGRIDLFDILMRCHLPLEVYTGGNIISSWIEGSNLRYFELYLAQEHTLYELRGHVERDIAEKGIIDVLDFFLERERDGEHIFDNRIIHFAARFKNVDVLDRILLRGYPVNEKIVAEDFHEDRQEKLPLYVAIEPPHVLKDAEVDFPYDDTGVLDRLLMYGVDVSLRESRNTSPVVHALMFGNMACFQRLLDVGCKIDNETDLGFVLFGGWGYHEGLTEEILDKLVAAGMDLNYRTSMGTPRYILERKLARSPSEKKLELLRLLQMPKYGIDYDSPLDEKTQGPRADRRR